MENIRGARLRKFNLRKIILGVRMHFRHIIIDALDVLCAQLTRDLFELFFVLMGEPWSDSHWSHHIAYVLISDIIVHIYLTIAMGLYKLLITN